MILRMPPRAPRATSSSRTGAHPPAAGRSVAEVRFAAVVAEPAGPGMGRARDPIAREVRLLGALLGQVIAEQGGPELFALVERVRRRTIALRRGDPGTLLQPDRERERLTSEIAGLDLARAAAVARAFTLYFQLVNLAEERERIRVLRTRARRARGGAIGDSIGEAVQLLATTRGAAGVKAILDGVVVHSVLTAHPTEARRRTLLVALRRIRRLLDDLDAPLVTPDEDADLRRRIREEISLLWHTGDLRAVAPSPLDEVRSALAIFDETLFTVVPRFQRAVDRALDAASADGAAGDGLTGPVWAGDSGRTGTRPVAAPALLRFGPGRAPGGHLRGDPPGRPAPGRTPAARVRGRRLAPDADRGGPGAAGAA
jgi:phosphoenolpyruvate carboxylase